MASLTPLIDAQGVARQNLYRPITDGVLDLSATANWQSLDLTGTPWEGLTNYAIHVYGPTVARSMSVLYAISPTEPQTNNNPDVARNEETQSLIGVPEGNLFWYKRSGGSTNIDFQVLAWV